MAQFQSSRLATKRIIDRNDARTTFGPFYPWSFILTNSPTNVASTQNWIVQPETPRSIGPALIP